MANCAAGSSGVGPGVNKRVLRIMVSPRFAAGCESRTSNLSGRINHIIHFFVIYVKNIPVKIEAGFRTRRSLVPGLGRISQKTKDKLENFCV